MSADKPDNPGNSAPAGKTADPQATLAELKKRNVELQSGVKVLQLRKASASPEQVQALQTQEKELRERAEQLVRLYLAVLRGQDGRLRKSETENLSEKIFKSVAVQYLSEQKVPNDLWKSLES